MGLAGRNADAPGDLTAAAEQPQMSLFVKQNKEIGKKVHQHRPKESANASGRV